MHAVLQREPSCQGNQNAQADEDLPVSIPSAQALPVTVQIVTVQIVRANM